MGRAFDGAYFGVENNRHMREHSGSALRRARAALWCAAALALLAVAAAGCGGDATGEPQHSTASGNEPATSTVVSVYPNEADGLVASPDVAFTVTFDWHQPDPARTGGILVWQQGNGVRRWDWLSLESGTPARGDFSIENNRSAGDALPYDAMGCMWWLLDTGEVDISCSEGSHGSPFGPVFDVIRPYLPRDRLEDETVAGRPAHCYSIEVRAFSEAVLCIDPSQGIPLGLSVTLPGDSLPALEMRALSVSTAEQNLDFPIELEYEPVTHGWQFEGTVPLSTLDLPDLSQFQN